ncbi:hypothetical protein KI387_015742, partial [Taxus chinensis]
DQPPPSFSPNIATNMEILSPANDSEIPDILPGLSKAYFDSPSPSQLDLPSVVANVVEEENVDDVVGVEGENVVSDVVVDTMEVLEEIVAEDSIDVAAAGDVDIGTAEILHKVLEKINSTFTVINNWKDHTEKTWEHLHNGCKELFTLAEAMANKNPDAPIYEDVNVLKNMIDM